MVQFDVIMALPVYINAGGSIREYINHDELYGRDDGCWNDDRHGFDLATGSDGPNRGSGCVVEILTFR